MTSKRFVVYQMDWSRIMPGPNGVSDEFDDYEKALERIKVGRQGDVGQLVLAN